MIRFELRTGFGFDIEANETNVYHIYVHDDEGNMEEMLVQFSGVIILLPFVKIEIGSFYDKDEWKLVKPTMH